LKCSARANSHLGFLIVPVDVIDTMKRSVFYKLSVPCFDKLDPTTYSINRHPRWLPYFRRMNIGDAITLHVKDRMPKLFTCILQVHTFFSSKLRQKS
jgi:hypothetical protein